MNVDFLLIGQGIAGTLLSYRLIGAGKKVYVIDQPEKNNSSRVAAGLFNPVTGRNMVKTWDADLIFPEIKHLYQQMEQALQCRFFHERLMYRPFASIEELNEWMGRSGEDEFKEYIHKVVSSSVFPEVNDPHGGVFLKQSGYVDMNTLLGRYAAWLKERGMLVNEEFDERKLVLTGEKVTYKDVSATSIIYVNGIEAKESRFFHWIPLIPNKGEMLVIKQGFAPEEIVNRGLFRIVLPNGRIMVGSTYYAGDSDLNPTESARQEMLEKLKKLIKLPIKEVMDQKVGIRPTTPDRRPLLGKHPIHPNVYIFNGLGAKGVSLAPYFSQVMFNLLVFENEPPKEVNISRFFKYI